MPGLDAPFYPWPYIEGVTMDEAMNDLAFMVTGMYGKPVPPQDGGPIRLALPWKYGFKSAKAIVKITFTDKRPINFWAGDRARRVRLLGQREPRRWRIRAGARRRERLLGTDERVPTQIYNGYG